MAYKLFGSEILTSGDTNTYLANSMATFVNETAITAGASTVTVSNCFSSAYDRYKIVISTNASATGGTQGFILSPNGSTSGQYTSGMYQLATSGTVLTFNVSAGAFIFLGFSGNQQMLAEVDNWNAFGSTAGKTANVRWSSYDNTASQGGTSTLWSTNGNSNTGFSLAIGGGLTMGTGTVRVYGYRKV
jgi:predicted phage tail protein